MATVGQVLTAPEDGWKRVSAFDQNFVYSADDWGVETNPNYYEGRGKGAWLNSKVVFKFKGTKLRIITDANTNHSNNIQITIDGEVNKFSINTSQMFQRLSYEKTGLSLQTHTVEIVNLVALGFLFQAIDIDSTGEMQPYSPIISPINLIATAGDSQVTLSWTAVDGATGYNVKRSTTAGGPYTTIAPNVTGTTYVDTAVTNGTTYYYVVTAITADGESGPSNEAPATPQAEGKVLLVIEMTDDLQKEYELTKDEVEAFITWFKNRAGGTGDPYYIFTKNFNLGPFDSRKDYLAFDKIQNFEVMAFTK